MGIGCYGSRPSSLKQIKTEGRVSIIDEGTYQYTCQDPFTFTEVAKNEIKMLIDKMGSTALKKINLVNISLDSAGTDQNLEQLIRIYDLFFFSRPSFCIGFRNCSTSESLFKLSKTIDKFNENVQSITLNFEPFDDEELKITEAAVLALVKSLRKHHQLREVSITLKVENLQPEIAQKLLTIPLELDSVKEIKISILDTVIIGSKELLFFVQQLKESKKELVSFLFNYSLLHNKKIEESQSLQNISSEWVVALFDQLHQMQTLKKLGFNCQSGIFLDSKAIKAIFDKNTKCISIEEFQFECKGVTQIIWAGEMPCIAAYLSSQCRITDLHLTFTDQSSFDNESLSTLAGSFRSLVNLKSLELDLKNTNISEKGLAILACLTKLSKLRTLRIDLQSCYGKFLTTLSGINAGLVSLREYDISVSKADNLIKFSESLRNLDYLCRLRLHLQNFLLTVDCAKKLGRTLLELDLLTKVELFLVDGTIEKNKNTNAVLEFAKEIKDHITLEIVNFNLTRCNINPTDHPIEELEKILSTAKNLETFGWSLNA